MIGVSYAFYKKLLMLLFVSFLGDKTRFGFGFTFASAPQFLAIDGFPRIVV